jgi:hypothetical protein
MLLSSIINVKGELEEKAIMKSSKRVLGILLVLAIQETQQY